MTTSNASVPMFDPTIDPLVRGGLTQAASAELLSAGWEKVTTTKEYEAAVAFKDSSSPVGVRVETVRIPEKTDILHNRNLGQAVIMSCGNPTQWRELCRAGYC